MSKQIVFGTERDLPLTGISLADTSWNKTGTWRTYRPVYKKRTPPCADGCPAGERVRDYLELVTKNKLAEALAVIREDNPLPGVCGRICYHPCETACNRGQFDEPIAVHLMERFVAENAPKADMKPIGGKTDKKVAVIGSGPAGLSCAYQLARRGHGVTVFEALSEPGGILRTGIPEYRLPKTILDEEIAGIQSLGVEIKANSPLGNGLRWSDLGRFQAVFLATGAPGERKLGIPGERAKGVISGLEFLNRLNSKADLEIGRRVVVVGAGNVGMDVSRSLIRLGVTPVNVEMLPKEQAAASKEEVAEAEAEGVAIRYETRPVRVVLEDGSVKGIECVKVSLASPDERGVRRLVTVEGSTMTLPADTIVVAIGQEADLSYLPPDIKVEGTRLLLDRDGQTTRQGIFAGGDVAGVGRVVDAIGAGKRAALAIDRYLGRGPGTAGRSEDQVVAFSELNMAYFTHAARESGSRLSLKQRKSGFREVNLSLTGVRAAREAARCFSCGDCSLCDNCWVFCPDMSVSKASGEGFAYSINYDYCKGCGVCARECPRAVIAMEEEETK